MRNIQQQARRGFSLIELVIVVVIIGILAAIAIPRLSRGASGASDSAVGGNLAVLRNAIDLYASEHSGTYPTVAQFEALLTTYSDANGTPSASKSVTAIYGPYIRKLPTLPVGPAGYKNASTVVDGSTGAAGTTPGGWFYNATTGEIRANTLDALTDATGKAFNAY